MAWLQGLQDKDTALTPALVLDQLRRITQDTLDTSDDKIVSETEKYQLPPPRWEITGDCFRAVLFAQKKFRDMDRADRVHACYLHAC